jgi:hypothetical protein
MDRRSFLRVGGIAGTAGLAGCSSLFGTEQIGSVPVPENRPDGIYTPGHVEGMDVAGMDTGDDFAAGVMYSYAHRFWTVTGGEVSKVSVESDDDVHLMSSVWDPETGTVLPEAGLSVEIVREDSLVSQETIYPMLSQPMGFHYGGNFGLDGDGEYTVRLSIGGVGTRRTGAFQGKFGQPATVEVSFDYSEANRNEISFRQLEDGGQPGAVDPMSMEMVPDSTVVPQDDLPGRLLGAPESDGAVLATTALDEPPAGIDAAGTYLAVSARTKYNRMTVPAMGLTATLARDDGTVYDGRLERTLDPDLGYHYGAVVDGVESGDDLTLTVETPPQVARHEGYETAFRQFEPVSLTP